MIKEIKMYTVCCDNCGTSADDDTDYSCWGDELQAKEIAMNNGFITEVDKHYCPNCVRYDDDDNLILKHLPHHLQK